MPTVIDSLVVELGLDASKFTKAQKEASEAWLRGRDAAIKANRDIEESAGKTSQSIDKVTASVLGLFSALLGAKSLLDFTANITQTDAALGRFAQNLGQTPQAVQQWEAAVQRVGGTAADADAALASANKQLQDLYVNGQKIPDSITRLGAMTGVNIDLSHGPAAYLQSIGEAARKGAALNRPETAYLLDQAGYGGSFGNVLMNKGGTGLPGYLRSMPSVDNNTIKQMQELQTQWAGLQQTFTQFFATMVGDFGPSVKPFLGDLQSLGDTLVKAEPIFKVIGDDTAIIAKNFSAIRYAIEAIILLLSGKAALGVLGRIGAMLGMGGGAGAAAVETGAAEAGAAAVGGGLLGTAGILAAGAGAAWLANTTPAGAGEGDAFRAFAAGAAARGYRPGATYDAATNSWSGGAGALTAGSTSSGGSWWTPERQQHAYDRLTKEGGLSDAGARALIARWVTVESPDGPTSVNPTSGAFGIGQWLGARAAPISGNTNFDDQLTYSIQELRRGGSEAAAGAALRGATGDAQGAVGASMYERAAGYSAATGTDNFTTRTLAGMASVGRALSLANSVRASTIQNSYGPTTSKSSVQTNIGRVVVNTRATNASGIADGIGPALNRSALAWAANYGPA